MKKGILLVAGMLCLAGLVSAAELVIPPDQPICRLYSMIQVFATIAGILAAGYSGFIMATTHDLNERNNSKLLLGGVFIGLIIVWLAPLVAQARLRSSP